MLVLTRRARSPINNQLSAQHSSELGFVQTFSRQFNVAGEKSLKILSVTVRQTNLGRNAIKTPDQKRNKLCLLVVTLIRLLFD
jgi:hypothetical protein